MVMVATQVAKDRLEDDSETSFHLSTPCKAAFMSTWGSSSTLCLSHDNSENASDILFKYILDSTQDIF